MDNLPPELQELPLRYLSEDDVKNRAIRVSRHMRFLGENELKRTERTCDKFTQFGIRCTNSASRAAHHVPSTCVAYCKEHHERGVNILVNLFLSRLTFTDMYGTQFDLAPFIAFFWVGEQETSDYLYRKERDDEGNEYWENDRDEEEVPQWNAARLRKLTVYFNLESPFEEGQIGGAPIYGEDIVSVVGYYNDTRIEIDRDFFYLEDTEPTEFALRARFDSLT